VFSVAGTQAEQEMGGEPGLLPDASKDSTGWA
jgi:hypothetical protein